MGLHGRDGDTHLLLICLRFGLYRLRNYRLWKYHPLKNNFGIWIAEGFTGCDLFQANAGGNVTRQDLSDFLSVIGVHL
jgi:hypothetical protein